MGDTALDKTNGLAGAGSGPSEGVGVIKTAVGREESNGTAANEAGVGSEQTTPCT